jgi:hypothetical protein
MVVAAVRLAGAAVNSKQRQKLQKLQKRRG